MAKKKRKRGKEGPGSGESSSRDAPVDEEPRDDTEPEESPEEGVGEATDVEEGAEEAASAGDDRDEPSPPGPEGADAEVPRPAPRRSGFAALAFFPSPSFLQHIHPKSVFARSIHPGRTLGLGLLSLYMAAILTLTGVLLMVYYVPSAAGAHGSIQDLCAVVPFGRLVRNVHRWAGHAMVLLVALHMLRTLLTGSYKTGRRGVWSAGVWLLVLTLAFAFTGYLLPWDQLAYWAVSIGGHLARNVPGVGEALSRGLLGGGEVGEATLVRFYALHVGVLPLLTTVFVGLHLYRIRRAGGLARPEAVDERGAKVPAWPHIYEREIALLVLATAAVLAAGLLFDAPLGAEPDPAHPENPAKAPWYFLGLQELVSYSSFVGGVLIPALALLVAALVPRLDPSDEGRGLWLAPRGGATAFVVGVLTAAVVFPVALAAHEGAAPGATGGLSPAVALLLATAVATAAVAFLKRSSRLAVLTLVGCATASVALLTAVGIWLRGPSWTLMLPWGSP